MEMLSFLSTDCLINQIIQRVFQCADSDDDYEQKRNFRVFFTSRKTLLNEFNHFEGNMNLFQPAIDISSMALKKENDDIEQALEKVRSFVKDHTKLISNSESYVG